jgi:hypothetical protein
VNRKRNREDIREDLIRKERLRLRGMRHAFFFPLHTREIREFPLSGCGPIFPPVQGWRAEGYRAGIPRGIALGVANGLAMLTLNARKSN